MKTVLLISGIYLAGFIIMWTIAVISIEHYKTKESPIIPAMFSWIGVVIALIGILYYQRIKRLMKIIHDLFR
jgi:hypothetical protein